MKASTQMDHGFKVDENRRCSARTKKERQCARPALASIELCALHSGLAKAKGKPGFGDPRALEAYKRSLVRRPADAPEGRRIARR